ncbi:uncharacterized protein LOC114195038 [Vigna unguiculata]|uniref:uncharacterized protein LOC114195038 n=1 Tax=Vigna unguiculata TaxID=3917 RepID=UPI001016E50C|nr:uncharacterized protein LOC114195038 [Vigna unguiculata]
MAVLPCCSRCAQSVVVSVATILVLFHQTCSAKHRTSCPSSSCGEIRDIRYPFRLKNDPRGCGLPGYEFECVNNRTLFTLFSGKYFVEEINYDRYQIRLIDPGVVKDTSCSFPRYFLCTRNFSGFDYDPLAMSGEKYVFGEEYKYKPAKVVFLNCSNGVSDDPRYVEVKADGCDSGGHIYAVLVGGVTAEGFPAVFTGMDVKVGCRLKVATFANWTHDRKDSCAVILKSLEEGFWLTWLRLACWDQCGKGMSCAFNQTTQQLQCTDCDMFHFYIRNCGNLSRIEGYLTGTRTKPYVIINFYRNYFLHP